MRLLRFMSAHEAIRLLQGKTLKNNTNHRATGQNSDSIGFCFAITAGNPDWMEIFGAAKRLLGITTMDVCLIGDAGESLMDKASLTWGRYATGDTSELCVTKYSLSDFDRWEMWTPELPPPLMPLKVITSPHWQRPKLTAKG